MARKRKVVTPEVAPAVEEQVIVNTPQAPNKTYKCLECGNVNEERHCKKCGGNILREV